MESNSRNEIFVKCFRMLQILDVQMNSSGSPASIQAATPNEPPVPTWILLAAAHGTFLQESTAAPEYLLTQSLSFAAYNSIET